MGYAARANARSPEGGKTPGSVALHRQLRAVDFFQGDKRQFEAWLDKLHATDFHRAHMHELWDKVNPKPLVERAS